MRTYGQFAPKVNPTLIYSTIPLPSVAKITAFTPLKDNFILGYEDGNMMMVNADGEKIRSYPKTHAITAILALSDDAIISGTADGQLCSFTSNATTPEKITISVGYEISFIRQAGDYLVIAANRSLPSGNGHKIFTYHLPHGELKEIASDSFWVCAMTVLKNGTIAYGGAKDYAGRLVISDKRGTSSTFKGHRENITTITEFTDNVLITGSQDSSLVLWDFNSNPPSCEVKNPQQGAILCSASPDDGHCFYGTANEKLSVWNKASDTHSTLNLSLGRIKAIHPLRDNKLVIFSPENHRLYVVDWEAAQQLVPTNTTSHVG